MEKYARRNDATGKGMNQGYLFNDGGYYCETEAEAKAYVESLGHDWETEKATIDTDEEWFFWTEWEELDEYWFDEDGNEYGICYKCGKESKVGNGFCQHCLTDL